MAKVGIRRPNPKGSFRARTTGKMKRSVKRALIPGYGKKGMGWVKNPKRAAYNAVYGRTNVGVAGVARAFALLVEGDCMDRVIPEGSHVLVDPDREPGNGSVAVVETEGYRAVMRRWYRGSSNLMLCADSFSEHDDMVFGPDDGPVRVVGTVVWFQAAEELE